MRATTILAVSALAKYIAASPATSPYSAYMKGFNNPTIRSSVGGHAICIEGIIEVTASAENTNLKLEQPKDQIELTNIFLELFQDNSTLLKRITDGPISIKGTYGIYAQMCFPTGTSSGHSSTLQLLVHGGGFDRLYWDNAEGYSYVDYAAAKGYMTFSYDRLGTGLSEHPDPINVVQTPLHVAIVHELLALLRSGDISNLELKQIVGVGHSYGSGQLLSLTTIFPKDLDVAVLTGASVAPDGQVVNTVGQEQTIAALNEPTRFSDLPYGYILPGSIEGLQWGFFRTPSFDPLLLDLAEMTKQPQAMGELILPIIIEPAANFTGPIFVLDGENDLPACFGNCLLPENKVAPLKDVLYPAASNSSDWYLVPKTGHGVNFHYTAGDAYDHIHGFLAANGL